MNKKLVWLGIMLFITSITFVNAYTPGFNRSGLICSGLTALDAGTDFSKDFFNNYVNGTLTVGDDPSSFGYEPVTSTFTSSSTHYTGMNLIYYTHIADNNGQCYGDWFDSTDKQGMYLYGYLYLIDPVTYITIDLTSYINDQKSYCTGGGIMFYDLSTVPPSLGKGPAFESSLLSMAPSMTPIYPNGAVDLCDTSATSSSWNGRSVQSYNPTIDTLQPGLYFVTVGIVSHSGGSNIQTSKRAGGGIAFKFNDVDNVANFVTNSTISPRFNIVTARLNNSDLNTLYGALIENTSWLCNAAGGELITDKFSSVFGNNGSKLPITFDKTHTCCGDDPAETYSFDYTDGQTYYCNVGVWSSSAEETECRLLLSPTPATTDNVYEPTLNEKPYLYYQIQNGSLNGSDGCCGDDIPSCYNPTLHTPCLYTDEQSCISNPLCRWRGESVNAFGFDYGYIGPSSTKQYMCYNYFSDTDRRDIDKKATMDWSWLNAMQDRFNIYTLDVYTGNYLLNNYNKTIDTVSNGDSWYYCNATSNSPALELNGNAIPEGQSPPTKDGSGMISCVDVMNKIFLNENDLTQFTEGCTGTIWDHCCDGTTLSVLPKDIASCGEKCYIAGGLAATNSAMQCNRSNAIGRLFCSDFVSGDIINQPTSDYFDKASCLYDMSGCLNDVFPAGENCKTGLNGSLCNINTDYCIGGKFVDSVDSDVSNKCCYGYGTTTRCKPQLLINTSADCSNIYGGITYDGKTQTCNGQNVSIGATGKFCCLNTVVSNQNVFGSLSLSASVSPNQFICYKDYVGNRLAQIWYNTSLQQFVSDRDYTENLLAQCIFDNSSQNVYKINGPTSLLDYSRGMLRGMGASLHVIANYDYFDSKGLVVDRVRRVSMLQYPGESYKRSDPDATRSHVQSFFLFGYTYLEFDIAYPTPTCNLKVVLQTNDTYNNRIISREIDMCPYLTAGDKSKRWNHVVIPLKQLQQPISTYEVYDSIVFRDYTPNIQDYRVVLDSITLTPGSQDLALNTPNYYCTGGFGTWIPSLNPPSTLNFSDWNQYGPYQFACDAQAAYSWTGQHCCGYNTKSHYGQFTNTDYAEFFSDTLSGCFNGSMIKSDWSVSYIYGIPEGDPSRFDSFNYKDILYYNNSFIGCQVDVNNGKYVDLKQSFDGQLHTGAPKIVSTSVNNQCDIKGSYYCADNAWRQFVNTANGPTNFNGQTLMLKTVPGGPELIPYGFRSQ